MKKRMHHNPAFLLLVGFLSVILFSFPSKVEAPDIWLPIIPDPSWVNLDYRKESGYSYINVSITFPMGRANISDWGTPTSINSIGWWASAEIWWMYPYVWGYPFTESHSYNLGRPPAGEYIFNFLAWGLPVTSFNFTVSYILGDVNRDGIVNVLDLTIVSLAYGSLEGEPDYNPEADINEDGIVDMKDLSTVARNLGKSDP